MKPLKFPVSLLIAALSLSTICVASVFTAGLTVTRAGAPIGSVKPIRGVDIFLECNGCKPHWQAKTQSDERGGFQIESDRSGLYDVSLQCNARCQGMTDLSAGTIQFTLTGAKESPFKRNITKQQLVDGVKFSIEIAAGGRDKEPRTLKGIVSVIK